MTQPATYAGAKPPAGSADDATISWTLTTADGTGVAVTPYGDYADRTVSFGGTFGGATVVLEGSLDGSEYFTLDDPQGNPISKTAPSIEAVLEAVKYIRPRLTVAGAGASINVVLYMRKNKL
jgi:hypothetical protein